MVLQLVSEAGGGGGRGCAGKGDAFGWGMRCLITAGPTREYLDPVRYLSNGSSGRMGYALAEAAGARGWEVDLVSGPVALGAPAGVRLTRVQTAEEMLAACVAPFAVCDLFIAVAAVADYRPKVRVATKRAKAPEGLLLELVPTVDVLRTLAARKRAEQRVVGFAAETGDLERRARAKLAAKNCDWIVANEVGVPGMGMDAVDNAVVLLGRDGSRHAFGPAPKAAVAEFILAHVLPPA